MQDGDQRVPFVLPDLGMGDELILATVWFASEDQPVIEGDRLLEVLVGDATVDLPSPATGSLSQRLVAEDQPLEPGQLLGYVTPAPLPHAG
jgi:pyruvate/2-oxoglutarate dehydrogenase complex dihydrolipoamide acyltransferase (E2) component